MLLKDWQPVCAEKFECSGSSRKPADSSKGDSCLDNTKLSQRIPTHKPIFDGKPIDTFP